MDFSSRCFLALFIASAIAIPVQSLDSAHEIETDVLIYIKKELNNHEIFKDWVKSDVSACEAKWSYLGCENGAVTQLLLSNKNLGIQPDAQSLQFPWKPVLLLKSLKVINIDGNGFTGPALPQDIASLKHLEELRLNKNKFNGSIPSQISSLVNLSVLDLSENEVSGEIPYGLYKTKLQVLNLASNKFDCFLPPSLSYVRTLERLSLANNRFHGAVPNIRHLYNLIFLELKNNMLEGSLPSNMVNASSLYHFDVSHNLISGEFPKDFVNHPALRTLLVNDNAISGNVPSGIFSSPSLALINLSNNFFNGKVPDSTLGAKTTEIKIDGNCFEGKLNQRSIAECTTFYTPVVEFS